QQRIMAELGFADPIDPDRPLNEIGLDSLRSVTLANNLEDEFGILISISELITGPTINQLSEHLSGLLAQRAHAPDEAAVEAAEKGNGALDYLDIGTIEETPPVNTSGNGSAMVIRSADEAASGSTGRWLIAPRPNPDAKVR